MKRTFYFLLFAMTLVGGTFFYEAFLSNNFSTYSIKGALSDIADEVVAVPLKHTQGYKIKNARHVRQLGNSLFLVSNDALYRFSIEGEFLGRVTDPDVIKVGGYIIDSSFRQLIVLGNQDDIHYYSFDGELLETKKLKSDLPHQRVQTASMYGENIWTTEERLSLDTDTQTVTSEYVAVKYDKSFNQIESRSIRSADLGREQDLSLSFHPELAIHPDTGQLYVYSPSFNPENLLRDTLYLHKNRSRIAAIGNAILSYPIRMGRRFWISSYNTDEQKGGLFCYDTKRRNCWQLANGLEDNFYNTGEVTAFQPMDIYNNNYYYFKSGNEVKKAFPEATSDSLILFIVKVKA